MNFWIPLSDVFFESITFFDTVVRVELWREGRLVTLEILHYGAVRGNR